MSYGAERPVLFTSGEPREDATRVECVPDALGDEYEETQHDGERKEPGQS